MGATFYGALDDWAHQDAIDVTCRSGVAVTLTATFDTPLCPDTGCFSLDLKFGENRCNYGNGTLVRLSEAACVSSGGVPGYIIPSVDTSYVCWTFVLPAQALSTHIVRIEPIIQNQEFYHHAVLFQGTANFLTNYYGLGTCTTDSQCGSDPTVACVSGYCVRQGAECSMGGEVFMYAWAVGVPAFDFPIQAGLPVGSPYVILSIQMHYDNPKLEAGKIDASGLRLFLTPNKRANDAGFVKAGSLIGDVFPLGIPPPGMPGFAPFPPGVVSYGFCDMSQIQAAMPTFPTVNIFAFLVHQHQIGARIWTDVYQRQSGRLVRTTQLNSPTRPYDFSRQEFLIVDPPYALSPTDVMLTQCQWDSSRKTTYTRFGEGSQDEMCFNLILVYPMPVVGGIDCFHANGLGFLNLNNITY